VKASTNLQAVNGAAAMRCIAGDNHHVSDIQKFSFHCRRHLELPISHSRDLLMRMLMGGGDRAGLDR